MNRQKEIEMNATAAEITTATVTDERCKHGQIASGPCKKCSDAAARRAARAANKTALFPNLDRTSCRSRVGGVA
jgi:hypothetical protein